MNLPIGERLPEDSDAFDTKQVPWVFDGDWPDWPAQRMLDWVPEEVQRQYGTTESSMINGNFLTFSENDERKLVASFWKAGYRCVRDDALVRAATGYGA